MSLIKKVPEIADYFVIALDFDGVLAQGCKIKMKYAKKLFNLDINVNQTKRDGFNKFLNSLGRTDITYDDLIKDIMGRYTMEYEVPKFCKDTLKKLFLEGFRLCVITSRNNEEYPYAKLFIEKNYDELITNVHNESPHPKLFNFMRRKSYFVNKLKPRIYVDDDLEKLKALENYPVELFYYRQPENIDKNLNFIDKKRINEISDWRDFYYIAVQLRELHEAICWRYRIVNKFSNVSIIYKNLWNMNSNQKQNLLREYKEQIEKV